VVNNLEGSDTESSGFTGSGLGLGDGIFSFDQRDNSFLLDDGGFFKTVTENSSD